MDSKDWYNCGAKIGELVQSAIDSNNFKQLNDAITETINETMESVQGSISKSMERRGAAPGKSGMGVYRGSGRAYDAAKAQANVRDVFDVISNGSSGTNARGGLKSIFSMVAGFGAAFVMGILGLGMLFLTWLTGFCPSA